MGLMKTLATKKCESKSKSAEDRYRYKLKLIKNRNHLMEYTERAERPFGGESQNKGVKIYTDGACSDNPGPGGWGAVLIQDNGIKELSGGEHETTNNRMELTAVIRAFEALKKPAEVSVYSDSSYIILGMTRWLPGWKKSGWRCSTGKRKNSDLWQQLDNLVRDHLVHWHWVKGHAGNKYNERADKLAGDAILKTRGFNGVLF